MRFGQRLFFAALVLCLLSDRPWLVAAAAVAWIVIAWDRFYLRPPLR